MGNDDSRGADSSELDLSSEAASPAADLSSVQSLPDSNFLVQLLELQQDGGGAISSSKGLVKATY